jgi:hypothetical protein
MWIAVVAAAWLLRIDFEEVYIVELLDLTYILKSDFLSSPPPPYFPATPTELSQLTKYVR